MAVAEQGLIDPARLEPLLDPEVLIWRDHTGEIMRAVIVEAWVRAWEARLQEVFWMGQTRSSALASKSTAISGLGSSSQLNTALLVNLNVPAIKTGLRRLTRKPT